MDLKIAVTKRNYYYTALKFLNVFLDLTDRELKLLAKFIENYKESEGSKEKIRWNYTFSTEVRKTIREELSLSTNNFNTTFHKLKSKNLNGSEPIIFKDEEIDAWKIHKFLLFNCLDDLSIKFILNEPKPTESNKEDSGETPDTTEASD